jgi:energy-coupling factor transporter ATP-binding protein EcfA2
LKISNSCPELRVQNLSLSFADQEQAIWDDLSFVAMPKEITAITGANASGKSSLIHALCGVIPQSIKAGLSGQIMLDSTDLRAIALCEMYRYMSVGLSDAGMQMMFPTVELELAFALENMGLTAAKMRHRISAAADFFGLQKLLLQAPQALSGGEQRLLLFAICDVMQSPILLLDEPETGLSQTSLHLLCQWLQKLKAAGKIVVLATHNEQLIRLSDARIALST